ncbi:hypothetical protein CDC59_19500 (plasmid) [Ralstonia solanacearum]|nr:hypothetical protein CDC59_19500 [Ralstonia solanacearum]
MTDGIRRVAGAVESGDPPAATAAFRQARRHRLAVSALTRAFRMNSGSQKAAGAAEVHGGCAGNLWTTQTLTCLRSAAIISRRSP